MFCLLVYKAYGGYINFDKINVKIIFSLGPKSLTKTIFVLYLKVIFFQLASFSFT